MKNCIALFAAALILSGCASTAQPAWSAAEYAEKYWAEYKNNALPAKKYNVELIAKTRSSLETFAPYLLTECEEIEKAMQWKKDTILAHITFGIKYPAFGPPPPHECTSWIITPQLTADGNTILHKNRDSGIRYLNGMQAKVPGKYSWTGIGNRCQLFPTMGINSCGLAVAMNSGNVSDNSNYAGLPTIVIARIILENCETADEAIELLEKIVKSGNYCHGGSGSIWFIADAEDAFIVEHDAKYIEAQRLKPGSMAIRANTWRFAGMLPHSKQTTVQMIGNHYREYSVRDRLMKNGRKNISVSDSIAASRKRTTKGPEGTYPPCGTATNSAAAFVIDREFPADLSTAYIAFGPPRHTVFIPVPATVEKLPDMLQDGSFCRDAVFRGRTTGLDLPVTRYEALEAEMFSNHQKALTAAGKLLKNGDRNGAKKVLNEAFEKNIKLLPRKW